MERIEFLPVSYKPKEEILARGASKTQEIVSESKKYGYNYFDGSRSYGYGGYKYDGRWRAVARKMIDHYGLKPGMKVLDIGCAKGFLVKDFMIECPGLEAFGLDISDYALKHCEKEVVGRLGQGTAEVLNYPDDSFDFVVSLNTLHNLDRVCVVDALREISRVSKGNSFVQVDAYYTPEDKKLFEAWVLTANYHDYPEGWFEVFKDAGYKGDYDWTVLKANV